MTAVTPRVALSKINGWYDGQMKYRAVGGGLLNLSRTAMDFLHTYKPSVGPARAYLMSLMNNPATENIDILKSPSHFFELIATFQPYMDRICRSIFTNGVNPREGDVGREVLNRLFKEQFEAQHHSEDPTEKCLNVNMLDSLMQKGLLTVENFKAILENENPMKAAQRIIEHPPGTAVEMREQKVHVM